MPKPSNVYVQKTLTYNCINISLCLEILEKVDEELSLKTDLHAELKANKLIFRVIGLESDVQTAINDLKEFLALYTLQKTDPRKGIRADILAKYVGRSIPLDVLAIVIKKMLAIPVEVRGATIYANTDLDTVVTIAKKIAEVQQKVEPMPYPNSLKKLLMAAIAIYNVSHVEILEALHNMKYLNEKNELTAPWVQALEDLDNIFESSIT